MEIKPIGRPYRLLICGDRNWTDGNVIREVLKQIGPKNIEVVIHGAARGADMLADVAAHALGIPRQPCPANWVAYGKGAGPMRNRAMMRHHPNYGIAFHDDIENSKGTADMVARLDIAGIPYVIISHPTPPQPGHTTPSKSTPNGICNDKAD